MFSLPTVFVMYGHDVPPTEFGRRSRVVRAMIRFGEDFTYDVLIKLFVIWLLSFFWKETTSTTSESTYTLF